MTHQFDAAGEDLLLNLCRCGDLSVGASFLARTRVADSTEMWRVELPEPAAVVLSPDESIVAVGGFDGSVRLLDAATGSTLAGPVAAHDGYAERLEFSPDGSLLVSSGTDFLVRLWTVDGLRSAGSVEPTADGAPNGHDASFVDDGRTLRFYSFVEAWEMPVDVEDLIGHVCAVVGRDLTQEEWTTLVGERPYQRICGGVDGT